MIGGRRDNLPFQSNTGAPLAAKPKNGESPCPERRAGDSEYDAMGFDDYLEFTRQWLDNRYAWTKPTA